MSHIAIIDYGMGNLHSVASALTHVAPAATVSITADPGLIAEADRVVFPGVGAMKDCMSAIMANRIDEVVTHTIEGGKPILGICVGMQSLMSQGEENGGVEGLNIISGAVSFFGHDHKDDAGLRLKVPHMGWNQVEHTPHILWDGIENNSRFYFVHSYYVKPTDETLVAGYCHYGQRFAAAIAQKNLFAVQFHPEKSDTAGLRLLRNFVQWQP